MKTERELFELLKKNAIQNILSVSGKSKTTEVIGEEFDKLFDVISASREGYKLVPVETLRQTLEWMNCVEHEFSGSDLSEDIKHADIIKAMIESEK